MQIYPHKAKINANIASIYAIINPKQESCNFQFPDICGAFVAWYLVSALKKELKVEKKELSTRFLNQMIKYLEKNKDEILSKTFKVSQDYFSESEIVFEAEKLFTYLFNKFEEKQRINTGIFIDRYLYRLNLQLVDDFLIINIISVEPRSIFMREEESDDIIVPDETSMKQLLKKNYKVLTNFINIRVQDYLFSEPNIIYIKCNIQ